MKPFKIWMGEDVKIVKICENFVGCWLLAEKFCKNLPKIDIYMIEEV